MPRHNSIRRASKLDHAVLILDVSGVIRFREGVAGPVLCEIAVEVDRAIRREFISLCMQVSNTML